MDELRLISLGHSVPKARAAAGAISRTPKRVPESRLGGRRGRARPGKRLYRMNRIKFETLGIALVVLCFVLWLRFAEPLMGAIFNTCVYIVLAISFSALVSRIVKKHKGGARL